MLNLQTTCKKQQKKNLWLSGPDSISEPLFLPEAEPGDILEIRLASLSPYATALCHAGVLALEKVNPHLPLASQGGCLLPSPLYPGNHLYLPVYQPGAGLTLGSPLVAILGKPLHVQAEVRVLEDFPLQRPRLENPFTLTFLACAGSARAAFRLALGDLLTFVQHRLYCSRDRAMKLVHPLVEPVFYCLPHTPAVTVSLNLPRSWAKRQ